MSSKFGSDTIARISKDDSGILSFFYLHVQFKMAPQKTTLTVPGVADGQELIGLPTGDESAMERVQALFEGSMSEDVYQVRSSLAD